VADHNSFLKRIRRRRERERGLRRSVVGSQKKMKKSELFFFPLNRLLARLFRLFKVTKKAWLSSVYTPTPSHSRARLLPTP
jgi:hypothetical protein